MPKQAEEGVHVFEEGNQRLSPFSPHGWFKLWRHSGKSEGLLDEDFSVKKREMKSLELDSWQQAWGAKNLCFWCCKPAAGSAQCFTSKHSKWDTDELSHKEQLAKTMQQKHPRGPMTARS